MQVLVIESDTATSEVLCFALANAGFEVESANSARLGLEKALALPLDAVVVGQDFTDSTGFDVCRSLREAGDVPVVLLTSCQREETVLRAFAAGADDVMARPVRIAELIARLGAITRRRCSSTPEGLTTIERGPFRLNPNRLEVLVAGRPDPIKLTPLEAKLLGLLMVNANQVMTKARLQELIWGYQNDSSGDLLKTHIRHLRVKIEASPSSPRYIQTINGMGYTFVLPRNDFLVPVPAVGSVALFPNSRAVAPASKAAVNLV